MRQRNSKGIESEHQQEELNSPVCESPLRKVAETMPEKSWRSGKRTRLPMEFQKYRGVLLITSIPVFLIAAVLLLIPRHSPLQTEKSHTLKELRHGGSDSSAILPEGGGSEFRYAVVLDAGSTGSRVHVFKFEEVPDGSGELKLLSDTFEQLKPGLSSFAGSPDEAAASLKPLLDTALKTVPKELQEITPISLKATAGLRLLPGKQSAEILTAVTNALKELPFTVADDAIGIMDGADEGGFAWLTLNYLLGKLGGSTVAAIDLGGGSVQEAFALSDAAAASAPDGYIKKLKAAGKIFNVYVHSYLGYGLMAARAKLIETGSPKAQVDGHPCFASGTILSYKYAGKEYSLKNAAKSGEYAACDKVGEVALEPEKTCGKVQTECSFNGAWRGQNGGPKEYYISSYFWDRAQDTGIISDSDAAHFKTSPKEFMAKATDVCKLEGPDAVTSKYPNVKADQAEFLCLDLSFCHTLLTDGFKLEDSTDITLVKQIMYNGQLIEAAWPLGAALNDLS